MLRALWAYREFILGAIIREFRGRYARSLLGGMWNILEPLAMIIIYTVIFSQVMQAKLSGLEEDKWAYSIFICIGIISWELFSGVIIRSLNMFLEQASLIKKTNFPRATLPVVILSSAMINFFINLLLISIFLIIIDRFPGTVIFAIIPLLIIQQGIAIGLGLILGTLNIFFRDIGKMTGIIIIFWFWLTPIIYPVSILPEAIKSWLFYFNPMVAIIQGYQQIFLNAKVPVWSDLWLQGILAVLLLAAGFSVFMRLSAEMVDEL